jgi:hypothetical protein
VVPAARGSYSPCSGSDCAPRCQSPAGIAISSKHTTA